MTNPTWNEGDPLTGARLARDVTGATAEGGEWKSYSPLAYAVGFAGTGVIPDLRDATLTGGYSVMGDLVHFWIKYRGGKDTNWNVGDWDALSYDGVVCFGLPFPIAVSTKSVGANTFEPWARGQIVGAASTVTSKMFPASGAPLGNASGVSPNSTFDYDLQDGLSRESYAALFMTETPIDTDTFPNVHYRRVTYAKSGAGANGAWGNAGGTVNGNVYARATFSGWYFRTGSRLIEMPESY